MALRELSLRVNPEFTGLPWCSRLKLSSRGKQCRHCVGASQDRTRVVLTHPRSRNKKRDSHISQFTKDGVPSSSVTWIHTTFVIAHTGRPSCGRKVQTNTAFRSVGVERHYVNPFRHRLISNMRPSPIAYSAPRPLPTRRSPRNSTSISGTLLYRCGIGSRQIFALPIACANKAFALDTPCAFVFERFAPNFLV